MTRPLPAHSLQLRSKVTRDGVLELFLQEVPIPALRSDQVLVRVEAAPINPSDLMLMLADGDPALARECGTADRPEVALPLPAGATARHAARLGLDLTPGNEGAGVVIGAGDGEAAQALLGRSIAAGVGGMWSQYRVVKAGNCLALPEGLTPPEGASAIVNPMTVFGIIGTMRLDGHAGLVHTAAASSLGQMLNRVCLEEGVALVNIVRRPEQAALLRAQGARLVCDSSAPDFDEALTQALTETGATVAFDAIGGGDMAGRILCAMEAAAVARAGGFARYGTSSPKQVWVYGRLDPGPTTFTRDFGWAWSVGGWVLPQFLARISPAEAEGLRARVLAGIRTTFATRYTREVSLAEMLRPEVIAACAAQATGQKILLRPHAT